MEKWRNGEMERWRDGGMERWRDGEIRFGTNPFVSFVKELCDLCDKKKTIQKEGRRDIRAFNFLFIYFKSLS